MRVLDLGCGRSDTARQAWADAELVRVDIDPDMEPDIVADVRALPEDIGLFDHILASHLLEHLHRLEGVPALIHWGEHLTEHGRLHVIVPDLEWSVEALSIGKPVPTLSILANIYGLGTNEWRFHKWGYTALLLRSSFRQAGLHVEILTTGPYEIRLAEDQIQTARQLYARACKKG